MSGTDDTSDRSRAVAGGGDGETNGPGSETRGSRADAVVDRLPPRARRSVETGLAVYRLGEETQVSLLAAAIAYYAFVSMVPLVVLGVVVATVLGGDALADQVVAAASEVLAPAGEELIRSAVRARTGLGGVTVAGLAVLLWGALKAFRALDRAFSLVYGTDPAASILASITDAVLALSAVGAGLGAMVVIGAAVAVLPGQVPGGLGAVALFVTLAVVFLPLYYLFPDADLAVREVVAGAVLAALGWTVLGGVFQLYATYLSGASLYGLLGGVLLALAWLYLGALLLLYGAVLNAVRSGHAPSPDQ